LQQHYSANSEGLASGIATLQMVAATAWEKILTEMAAINQLSAVVQQRHCPRLLQNRETIAVRTRRGVFFGN